MKQLLISFFLLVTLPILGLGQTTVDSTRMANQVDSLIQLCRTLTRQNKYDEAKQVIEPARIQAREIWGDKSLKYGECIFNLGTVYMFEGKSTEAASLYLEVKAIRENVLGKSHPEYAKCLNNLALVYFDKGEYDKAEGLYLESKDIWERLYGRGHQNYALTLNNLAKVYDAKGQYDKAKLFYLEAITIREKIFGKEHPIYAGTLIGLATAYKHTSEYDKAVRLYSEAKAIHEKVSGKENTDYALSVEGLALVYFDKGEYDKALILFNEIKAIQEKIFGKEDYRYASTLNHLALVYQDRGEYDKALALHAEAQTIHEKGIGRENPYYASNLDNMAIVYMYKGDYDKAISLHLETKAIREKVLGKKSPEYAYTVDNLALVYEKKGEIDAALALYLEAKPLWESIYGNQHPNYAKFLSNIATVYKDKGEYDKALILQSEVLGIWENVLGKEHPYYARSLRNIAVVYNEKGDFSNAASYLLSANTASKMLLQKASAYSSEKEMLRYQTTFEGKLDYLLKFIQKYPKDDLISAAYDNTLFLNNALLFNSIAREKSIAQADSSTKAVYTEWKSCHFQLAKQYALPKSDRDSARVAVLEEQANGYEKELARRAPDFVKSQQTVSWQDLKQQLKPREAALEFVHFNAKTKDNADSTFYAALLIRPEWSQPRMVKLFEQREIQPLLAAANTAASAGQLYASRGVQNSPKNTRGNQGQGIVIPGQKSANLYQLSWAPIDSLLKDCKTVYYAPSGLLHRLNLGAIAVSGTEQTLADRYQLVQLGSTRQLIGHERNTTASTRTATLFGGLRYDTDAPMANADSTDQTFAAYDVATLRSALGGRGGDAWVYLPGTEKEVKNAGFALKNAGFAVQTFSGNQGTEAAFKTLGQHENPAPTVLHIATHGFFFPDPKDSTNRNALRDDREPVFKTSDNPLLRSGLILAGANPAWAGARPPEAQEDGILTAYEISQMNLHGTELVVLSACETGLGDVEDNEGVYGLKRAFKIAGARYLIMSLWQVPDKQTQELMSVFYKNWLEQKMDIPAAFETAQKSMRKRYGDPFFWAGFVLVE